MSHELQSRIRSLRSVERGVRPDEAWVNATRETLLMQVRNSLPTEPVRPVSQVRSFIRHFIPVQVTTWMRGPAMAMLSIFAIALGGSVASVSAAEQALPGDFLYSLKLATEQARLALTSQSEDKLKLKLDFTARRGEDLKQVVRDNSPSKSERIVQAADILKRDLNTVKEQLDDVKKDSPTKVVEIAKLVDQKSNELVQTLQDSKAGLSDASKDKVIEAQAAAADAGVKAIEVLVEKHQESADSVTATDVAQVIQDHTKTVADVTGGALSIVTTSTGISTVSATGTTPLNLDQAVDQIKLATQQAFATQTSGTASSTGSIPGSGSTSSTSVVTLSGSTSSTSQNTSTSSTTPP